MFHFYSLYSGSSGNSLFVETSNTKILIDAGESAKKITEALSHLHVDVSDINAIFVTHEHTDHTKGLATLSKKYQIPVFANQETWNAMPSQADKIPEEMKEAEATIVKEEGKITNVKMKTEKTLLTLKPGGETSIINIAYSEKTAAAKIAFEIMTIVIFVSFIFAAITVGV